MKLKYVTALPDCNNIIKINGLTPEKDYKVVQHLDYKNQVIIIDDSGEEVLIHLSHFYPQPVTEDILPEVDTVELEDDFSNLVRSDYILQGGDWFNLSKLTKEQKLFLTDNLPVFSDETFFWEYGSCHYTHYDYFTGCKGADTGKELSFNDLFIEKCEYEEGCGFEDLVFVQPDILGASISLKKMSSEQINFICKYFNIEQPEKEKTHFSCLTVGEKYFSSTADKEKPCYNLSFNDIFKYKDEI